ncbi:MAG: hypothetical protein HYX73_02320 [Acidobacteria bacterium]|nr:hypothetical protein [Acidobacteriota bacterium]
MTYSKIIVAIGLAALIYTHVLVSTQEQLSGQDSATVEDVTRELGPFQLSDQRFTVVLHERHITGATVPDPEWQTTLAEIEIKDEQGAVHYRESFPYEISGNEFSEILSASVELLQGHDRSGLLVTYGSIPSTPLGGQSWQVFGLFENKLVPFSKPIYAEGELATEPNGGVLRTETEPNLQGEVLNFRVWTGNFFVLFPVRVDFLMGKVIPAWRCFKVTARGNLPQCQYRLETDRQPQEEEMTFVRMHPEAEEGIGSADHIVVKRDSQVEFLAAEGEVRWEEDEQGVGLAPGDDFWIKVRIDGKEGWIHTQEDFAAIGLPQAR